MYTLHVVTVSLVYRMFSDFMSIFEDNGARIAQWYSAGLWVG
jgi:hypothetical protein